MITMKKILFIFLAICVNFVFGQEKNTVKSNTTTKTEINYEIVDKLPVFPGGLNAFRTEILQKMTLENIKGSGRIDCDVTFVVDADGKIVEVKSIGKNRSFNREAEYTVKNIKTKWIPAELKGEKVRYRFSIPLSIYTEESKAF